MHSIAPVGEFRRRFTLPRLIRTEFTPAQSPIKSWGAAFPVETCNLEPTCRSRHGSTKRVPRREEVGSGQCFPLFRRSAVAIQLTQRHAALAVSRKRLRQSILPIHKF